MDISKNDGFRCTTGSHKDFSILKCSQILKSLIIIIQCVVQVVILSMTLGNWRTLTTKYCLNYGSNKSFPR